MPYAGLEVNDVRVALSSGGPGTATITHDALARLTISVKRDSISDAMMGMFHRERTRISSSDVKARPSILVEGAFQRNGNNDVQEFKAHEAVIAHRELRADDVVTHDYYVTGIRFVDRGFDLRVGGHQWRVDGVADADRTDTHGYEPVTAVISSEPAPRTREGEVDDAAEMIILLMSFAAGGQVFDVRRDQKVDGAVAVSRLRDNTWVGGFSSPLALGLSAPGTLKTFVESSYDSAVTAGKVLPLARLIRIVLELRGERVVETRGLLAAKFLETLRLYYGSNVLARHGRVIRKGLNFYRTIEDRKKNRRMSFAEVIGEFARDHRITRWKPEFTNFRNRMFHGGDLKGSTLLEQYWRVMDVAHFCDVVILALLNWDVVGGRYVPCNADPNVVTEEVKDGRKTISYGINVQPFTR